MIQVSAEILDMVEAGELALLGAKEPIFVHAGRLVRVVTDAEGARLVDLSQSVAKGFLARHAVWFGVTKEGAKKRVLPPRDVVEAFATKGDWSFPKLDGIVTSPTLRPDGTVLDAPGYDAPSRLVYAPDREFPKVPEQPSLADARGALEILKTPLVDFPFVSGSDRSAAIAVALTVVGRPAIQGPTPFTPIRANVAGTGKGLLADVIAASALGRQPARLVQTKSDEEEEKLFLALGLEGARLVLIDNVDRPLSSPVLAAALTAVRFKARRLGKNSTAEIVVPVLLATGNNLTVSGDIARRSVPCDMEILAERPDERTGFKLDLPGWAFREHARLVTAALTVLRAYVVAGRPPQPIAPFGSYESWSGLVRSSLVWAGEPDPCATRSRFREESDVGLAELRVALSVWRSAFGDTPVTTAEVLANIRAELLHALSGLAGVDPLKLDARRLGYALRRTQKRVVDGLRFERSGETRDHAIRWRVSEVITRITRSDPHLDPQANASESCDLRQNAGDAGDVSQSLRTRARARAHPVTGDGKDHPHHPLTRKLDDEIETYDEGPAGDHPREGFVEDPDGANDASREELR